ncbi:27882_t:CDS:1, partial [Dentiscutata erythropus]
QQWLQTSWDVIAAQPISADHSLNSLHVLDIISIAAIKNLLPV